VVVQLTTFKKFFAGWMLLCLSVSLIIVSLKPNTETTLLLAFAHITDSHCGAPGYTEATNQSVQWIQRQNDITFVVHTGDLVQKWNDTDAWTDISQIMHQLDGVKQWVVLTGNHDVGANMNTTFFTEAFGNESLNQILVAENFVFVTLSWPSQNMTKDDLAFLQLPLKFVVASHWLHSNPHEGHGYESSPLTNVLRDYPNVVLAVSGHNDENDFSNNFVASKSVGRGYVRVFYLYSNSEIHVRTWSVQQNHYLDGRDDDFWIDPSS